jgi:hypothetical protein
LFSLVILGCIGAGYWYFVKPSTAIPGTIGGSTGGSTTCVVENCHGLDIKCGPNPAQVCTAMYGIGDRCLQYAKCGVLNGTCRQLENPQFTKCKSCVQKCTDDSKDDVTKLFDCESKC